MAYRVRNLYDEHHNINSYLWLHVQLISLDIKPFFM